MLDSLFDLPLWIAALLIIGSLCLFAVCGLLVVRKLVLPRLNIKAEDGEFSGTMVQAVMGFYGLAVALIAVSVWDNYSDVSDKISLEASELSALYRDASGYPEPIRPLLQKELADYATYIITEAWPLQKKGLVARGGFAMLNRFQATLEGFEPTTEGQKIMHAEALRAYNEMLEARSLRLDAVVDSGLQGVMWVVIVVGAMISLNTSFFFQIEDIRVHGILVGSLAVFVGLVIFLIFAFDRPFRGELGLGPEPYQLVYDNLMKPDMPIP